MTRSSSKKLVKPFDELEQAFHLLRRLFRTPSLDHSNPLRPKFDEKAKFELNGQFLKELRDNTFSGSDNEDENEHIERVLEIVDLFTVSDEIIKGKFLSKYCPLARTTKKMEEINNFQQELDETLYQAWDRFNELFLKCPQYYLTNMQEVILFYKGLDVHTRQILDSKGAVPKMSAVDAKKAIQEMVDHSQKWHDGASTINRSSNTFDALAAVQAERNNLGREIKKVNEKVYASQVGCELCNGPHYTKDCPLKEEGKTLEEADNGNPSYQERRQTIEESLSKFMTESIKIHDENSNLIKEIRALTVAAIKNQGASIKALEIQIWKMSKVLQERGYESLPSLIETNPRDHVKSISTSEEAETPSICHIGSN
ncbi:zf-CCHC domain-containing protein [Tanacetum coccineum]